MRWQQVFGSGVAAWLVKLLFWVVVVFVALWFVPPGLGPGAGGPDAQPLGTPGHDIGGLDIGLGVVMTFIVAFVDGVLMLVIGGLLVSVVQHRRLLWRDGMMAGLVQGLLLGWWAAGIDGFGRGGFVAAGAVVAIELIGAAVGVVVWRRMQRDGDVTQAF